MIISQYFPALLYYNIFIPPHLPNLWTVRRLWADIPGDTVFSSLPIIDLFTAEVGPAKTDQGVEEIKKEGKRTTISLKSWAQATTTTTYNSMTSLLPHTVAQPTKWRFLPKNSNQLFISIFELAFTWLWVDKNRTQFQITNYFKKWSLSQNVVL